MTSGSSFTIVVGIDGSPDAQLALSWAVDEARQRNGRLRLIIVWNKPALAWFPSVLETAAGGLAVVASPEEDAEKLYAKALKFAADAGVSATGQVVHHHSAASVIIKAAPEADLVVVGSRGQGGFHGLHLGSVSSQVVNHAPCPVLIIRPKTSKGVPGPSAFPI